MFDEPLRDDALCYGLPFGILGIISWSFTTLEIILKHKNINIDIISLLWRKLRGKDDDDAYESSHPYITIFFGLITVGPVIHTCIKCHGNWKFVFIALGQLAPWSFGIFNNGFKSLIEKTDYPVKNSYYILFGINLVILFSLFGWIGVTGLLVSLYDILKTKAFIIEFCISMYLIPFFIITYLYCMCYYWCLTCCKKKRDCNTYIIPIITSAYIMVCLHVIGSYVLLALVNEQWSGITKTGGGIISTILFFIGKFVTNLFKFF
ncbi:hypothetical protein RclHR1_03340010 [Rhizophagus clarus]|uniref:Uncharacterized protein n=1 Tax=Rhizophagus clarus TaxID=94130 RepID=A0A2Z6RNY7_9GLOM|nr:hypothetical protein RclHR1_03340010 [Rhizophagus clarus]GES84839.1 hypothetical protein GLOIN_2v1645667 [Rhizophagus clarus]